MVRKRFVFWLAASTLTFALASVAQQLRLSPSKGDLKIPTSLEGKRLPKWGGNALVVAEGPAATPVAFVGYDSSANIVFSTTFSIPESIHTFVANYTRGNDGTLALCGRAFAADGGSAPFIALISADGLPQQVIRTAPYSPQHIAIAPDGTLWAVGGEFDSQYRETRENPDAGVLRHFDRSGEVLGSFVSRSTLPNFIDLDNTQGYLAESSKAVGWLHRHELSIGGGAYVEVSPSGGEVVEYPLPELPAVQTMTMIDGMGMTEDGQVFVALHDGTPGNGATLVKLDRAAKTWRAVAFPPGVPTKWVYLYGASGNDLAFYHAGEPKSTVRFFTPSN